MKSFRVFWHSSINGDKQPYVAKAMVLAGSVGEALAIASTYGEVASVHSESDMVITEAKRSDIPAQPPRIVYAANDPNAEVEGIPF
jgi:hypothetical protein